MLKAIGLLLFITALALLPSLLLAFCLTLFVAWSFLKCWLAALGLIVVLGMIRGNG